MPVRYLDLGRSYARHQSKYNRIAQAVWSSGQFFYGPAVEELEKRLAPPCHRTFATTLGSCTDALYFSLKAVGVGPGDEVILTSFSHIASVSSILRAGATPVFADIDENNFMMSMKDLDRLVTPKTRVLLAVHMFGDCLDMDAIDAFVLKHNLLCIEDGAQSFGAKWRGRPVGSLGQLSCLSFDPLKNLSSFASGGAILSDREDLVEFFDRLSHHGRGRNATRDYEILGFNSKIPTIDAAILNYKIDFLAEELVRRTRLADCYTEILRDVPEIQLPSVSSEALHTWHKYTVLCDERDRLEAYLQSRGLETRRCWKMPLYAEGAVKSTGVMSSKLPGVEYACEHLLSLPLYSDLTEAEVTEVALAIRTFYLG